MLKEKKKREKRVKEKLGKGESKEEAPQLRTFPRRGKRTTFLACRPLFGDLLRSSTC